MSRALGGPRQAPHTLCPWSPPEPSWKARAKPRKGGARQGPLLPHRVACVPHPKLLLEQRRQASPAQFEEKPFRNRQLQIGRELEGREPKVARVGDRCRSPDRQVEGSERRPRREDEPKPLADRKSTRLNSSHGYISYAVFC